MMVKISVFTVGSSLFYSVLIFNSMVLGREEGGGTDGSGGETYYVYRGRRQRTELLRT